MHPPLFGGLTVEQFLARHWHKRPLLVRGAWPDFVPPISAEELAGLACEEQVESLLVALPARVSTMAREVFRRDPGHQLELDDMMASLCPPADPTSIKVSSN